MTERMDITRLITTRAGYEVSGLERRTFRDGTSKIFGTVHKTILAKWHLNGAYALNERLPYDLVYATRRKSTGLALQAKEHNDMVAKKTANQDIQLAEAASLVKLDQAWAEINAQCGFFGRSVPHDAGYGRAISMALNIIEKHGGMDPQKRSRK